LHLVDALKTLTEFAAYSVHPDVVFESEVNPADVKGTADNFEQGGFEEVVEVLRAASALSDSRSGRGILDNISRATATTLAMFELALMDLQDQDSIRNGFRAALQAAGLSGEESLQYLRDLASLYAMWTPRVTVRAEPDESERTLAYQVTELFSKLGAPPCNPAPTGGILVVCTADGQLVLRKDGEITTPKAGPTSAKIQTSEIATGDTAAVTPTEQSGQARRRDSNAHDGRAELDQLVGLKKVKESLSEIRSLLAVNSERQKAELPVPKGSLHAVFAGNPGTGKTTVARIYAEMLKEFGYLRSGQLVEADRGRLVAEYLGQTAVKTTKVLQEALGGVLFIDEAYALKNDPNDSFGQECIDTLLKFMEDHRENLVVIAAGYKDRIAALLETNPGFKSRFAQFLTSDLSTQQQ
jgi:SpoVK/Ycf46/Vps4 family AAA+-type ATPase